MLIYNSFYFNMIIIKFGTNKNLRNNYIFSKIKYIDNIYNF